MANIKSAKKRILQNNKRRIQNKSVRTETKSEVKKFLQALLVSQDKETLLNQLKHVEKILDKAVSKGVIHKNKSARLKSRIHLRFNASQKEHAANVSNE